MAIRLNKVTRDLNVGISTVVDFLQKKGYEVEANPNTRITEEQYDALVKEFRKDKDLKIESEKKIQGRQNKDRNKASVSIEDIRPDLKKTEEIQTIVSEDYRPKVKTVGKINLDEYNRKGTKPAPADTGKALQQVEVMPVPDKKEEQSETVVSSDVQSDSGVGKSQAADDKKEQGQSEKPERE